MGDLTSSRKTHNKDMAREFLSCLDPSADKFTFQFFSDGKDCFAKIFHGTLDQVWPEVLALNTLERRAGVFVTVNATDLQGRRTENIVRVRALFVDADTDEQTKRCIAQMKACGVTPSLAVKSGRGFHFYFCADDIPRDQFGALQERLIEKFGTDPAVKDLPRVMRLPGTLHLKKPDDPRPVKFFAAPAKLWQRAELVAKLRLATAPPSANSQTEPNRSLPARYDLKLGPGERERLQKLSGHLTGSLADGIDTNIEKIRSAMSAIPPSAIASEGDWVKVARALAHEAAVYKGQTDELWEILDNASLAAPGYNEADNRSRWRRYTSEALDRENPITIATVFDLARKNGWQGWAPQAVNYRGGNTRVSAGAGATVWRPSGLKVSFSNIPHRQWLYGFDLIRGELTVLASPGGVGKSSLAIGMAISAATGRELLGEKVRGGNGLEVLLINAEDSGTEIRRRVWAFCRGHGIAEQSLSRLNVAGADDPHVQCLSFLRTNSKNVSELDVSGFAALTSAFDTFRPDIIVLDPLVALCAGGNMNDNASMSLVMRELKRCAGKYNCAVLIVHHTRKGADVGSAESVSGAAAIVNLARRAIMPVPMTEDEAKKNGVLPSERFRYFKLVDAKSNLAPRSADAPWYQLHSVELPNPQPPVYPTGDSVQAITRAILPLQVSAAATVEDQKMRRAILELVDRGKVIDGIAYPYSPSLAGAKNQRGLLDDAIIAVEAALTSHQLKPIDLETVTRRAIEDLQKDGWLIADAVEKLKPDAASRFRRGRGLGVVWSKTPWDRGVGDASATDTEPMLNEGGQLVNASAID
ncbi:AAA family ATPase [Nitrobacter sp. JJSN]|uniref:AAA family ATPase n=1 Tax=Nitrobacter sp. JJSN TaxID=3453033 RepID=UPI003F761A4D